MPRSAAGEEGAASAGLSSPSTTFSSVSTDTFGQIAAHLRTLAHGALHGISGPEPFVDALKGYLKESMASAKDAIDIIQYGDLGLSGKWTLEEKETLLMDSAFELIPPVAELTCHYGEAVNLFLFLAHIGRPKEVLLGLQQALRSIGNFVIPPELVADPEVDQTFWADATGRANQLQSVIFALGKLVKSLPFRRSAPAVASLCKDLRHALPAVMNDDIKAAVARSLLVGISRLVRELDTWSSESEDYGEGQKQSLYGLMSVVVARLGPRLDAELSLRWFLHHYRQYSREEGDDLLDWKAGQVALDEANKTIEALGVVKTWDLVQLLGQPAVAQRPVESIMSLHLIAAGMPEMKGVIVNPMLPHSVDDVSSCLSLALTDAQLVRHITKPSPDAAIALLWSVLSSPRCGPISFKCSASIIENLIPWSARLARPILRTMGSKLMEQVIKQNTRVDDKIALWKLLLEAHMVPVRLQAVNLLRDAITQPFSTLRVPALFYKLAPILFDMPIVDQHGTPWPFHLIQGRLRIQADRPIRHPPSHDVSPFDPRLSGFEPYSASSFLPAQPEPEGTTFARLQLSESDQFLAELWPSWFTECANLLRLWRKVDADNDSGIQDTAKLAKIAREWIKPQLDADIWSILTEDKEVKDEQEILRRFVFARWRDALDRLVDDLLALQSKEIDKVLGGRKGL